MRICSPDLAQVAARRRCKDRVCSGDRNVPTHPRETDKNVCPTEDKNRVLKHTLQSAARMLVLVANLGSTSCKFKLLDMDADGDVLASGGYERIGQAGSPYATHADVIDVILKELPRRPDAIGFKAVHGGPISGAVRVTDEVIATMEQFADVAPAHNPPYIAAMKAL